MAIDPIAFVHGLAFADIPEAAMPSVSSSARALGLSAAETEHALGIAAMPS